MSHDVILFTSLSLSLSVSDHCQDGSYWRKVPSWDCQHLSAAAVARPGTGHIMWWGRPEQDAPHKRDETDGSSCEMGQKGRGWNWLLLLRQCFLRSQVGQLIIMMLIRWIKAEHGWTIDRIQGVRVVIAVLLVWVGWENNLGVGWDGWGWGSNVPSHLQTHLMHFDATLEVSHGFSMFLPFSCEKWCYVRDGVGEGWAVMGLGAVITSNNIHVMYNNVHMCMYFSYNLMLRN